MGMGIFLSIVMILSIFNIGYYIMYPDTIFSLGISAITSFIGIGIIVAVLSGFSAFSVSLSDASQRLILIVLTLVNLLFQITIPLSEDFNIPIGLGLLSNLFNVFAINDVAYLGWIFCTIMGILALVSGLQMVVGVGEG